MAVKRSEYSSFKEYPGPILRQGPFNIDASAMYTSRAAALEYAQTNPSAYEGQILTVTETNPDGSTSLYYFGIKNHDVTNSDGTTSSIPQLMQIMTLVDSQNLLDVVGAVKYCGTLPANINVTKWDNEYVHDVVIDRMFSAYGVTPRAGNMYNVYFADSSAAQAAHCYNKLDIIASPAHDGWSADGDSVCIDALEEITMDDGSIRYGVSLRLGMQLNGVFPPYVPNCWNYISFTLKDDQSNAYPIFYEALAYGFRLDHDTDTAYPLVTLLFKEGKDAVEDLDEWAKSHFVFPEGASTLYPARNTAKDSYNLLKEHFEADNIHAMNLVFAQLLRNGDNIIYNGKFWDVLSGMVNLDSFATKDEVASAVSNSTSIYRQE